MSHKDVVDCKELLFLVGFLILPIIIKCVGLKTFRHLDFEKSSYPFLGYVVVVGACQHR